MTVTATLPGGEHPRGLRQRLRDQRRPRRPARSSTAAAGPTSRRRTAPRAGSTSPPGAEGPSDHAYYLEMRDRSGFDRPARARTTASRSPSTPASTTPTPTRRTATATPAPTTRRPSRRWTARRSPARTRPTSTTPPGVRADTPFTDSGDGHTDNYEDPGPRTAPGTSTTTASSYDVLVDVRARASAPRPRDGDLTGAVAFTIGQGCGDVRLRLRRGGAPGGRRQHRSRGGRVRRSAQDVHAAARSPSTAPGEQRRRDPRRPRLRLGRSATAAKDAGEQATHRYRRRRSLPGHPDRDRPAGRLRHDRPARWRSARLVRCRSDRVDRSGGFRVVRHDRAAGGSYCDNRGPGRGRDVLSMSFSGPRVTVIHGDSARGGRAAVFVDGERRRHDLLPRPDPPDRLRPAAGCSAVSVPASTGSGS